MNQEATNRYLLLRAGDLKMLLRIEKKTRVLQPYEYRVTPGNMVKALHMGNPLVDLGQLVSGKNTGMGNGVMLANGFGFLVDGYTEDVEITNAYKLDPEISDMKGNILDSYGQTEDAILPILSVEKIFSTALVSSINSELRDRKWI